MPNSTPPIQRASRICDRKMTTAPVTRMAKALPAMRWVAPCSLASQARTRAGRRNADARGGGFRSRSGPYFYKTMAMP